MSPSAPMPTSPIPFVPLVVCEQCDAVFKQVELGAGEKARCSRCGSSVGRYPHLDVDRLLAVTLAALIVFTVANLSPIVSVEFQGATISSTLWGTFVQTWKSGYWPISLLAALMTFVAPLVQLVAMLYVLLPLRRKRRATYFNLMMHLLRWMKPWSMVEVFLFGSLVAVVRLWSFAHVTADVGIVAFVPLSLLMAWVGSVDLHLLWSLGEDIPA